MKKIILLLACTVFGVQVIAQTKLQIADSLFAKQEWKTARQNYMAYMKDTSTQAYAWNRLGFCNQNLGNYDEALKDYQKALDNKPFPPTRGSATIRMARVYALTNKFDKSADMLVRSAATGYNPLPDMDTLADFKTMREAADFKTMREKVYNVVFPCAGDPHAHEFDFWIGEWDVYNSGAKFLVGHSVVQSISNGCALLENWTSAQASTGKSINYYDTQKGSWEQDWIGSGGGPQHYYNGVYKDGAMQFTYEATNPQGQKTLGHFKFFNIDKNTVRQYLELSTDDGKTYQPSYDFTYVRKRDK